MRSGVPIYTGSLNEGIPMINDIDITIQLVLAASRGSRVGFERERLLWAR
jgi:hypothetical protein